MTSPSTGTRAAGGESAARSVLGEARNPVTLAAAAGAFLFGSVSTWYALRIAFWPAFRRDLNAAEGVELLVTAPWDVILVQAQVAAVVGLVLAVEVVAYRARGALVGERWWLGDPLARPVRALLVAVGVALFPVGALVGYDQAFPLVLDALASGDPAWTVGRWARIGLATAVVSGLAAQLAFVGVVASLGGRPPTADRRN